MGSGLRNMHRAGLALVLFVLAKELPADPHPQDVVNVHLHLNELEDSDDGDKGGNRNILNVPDNNFGNTDDARVGPDLILNPDQTNSPTIAEMCSKFNCPENGADDDFGYFVCCHQNFQSQGNQANGVQLSGNEVSAYPTVGNDYKASGDDDSSDIQAKKNTGTSLKTITDQLSNRSATKTKEWSKADNPANADNRWAQTTKQGW